MYLKKRPNFTFDPLFHAGLYYVQEASSMFVYHVLKQVVNNQVLMLDLCAAPGGKTTHLLSYLENTGILVSN
jgi:16S rRNA C967 or C1407 C5-methylase (RsmB/RsmF family)